ncbi:hypothetical protein KFK09_023725 [Dendrobium nobile]|uniref:Uncharacterized protein n=1 Tax=Dendrobium nobile TaxID=94219 RepID=A0A8T3AAK2_DENNO|nr:hypothetical protein KFK09_023725 [Dendrobium nobile]
MKKHERDKVLSQSAISSCWSRSSYRNFRSHRKGKSSIERERASEKDRERKGGRMLSPPFNDAERSWAMRRRLWLRRANDVRRHDTSRELDAAAGGNYSEGCC